MGLTTSDFNRAVRIDIITSIDGVDFRDASPRRVVHVDGVRVAFIGRDDLIRER